MKNRDKIIDKLLKIKSLADKGYKGEAEQAKKQLQKLLLKYDLTISDLESEDNEVFYVPYSSKMEESILIQIIAYFDLKAYSIKRGNRKVREIQFEGSKLDYAEILDMFAFHRKLLKEEIQTFISAYIHKHKLFRPTTSKIYIERIGNELEMTIEEKQKAWRMANMMEGLSHKRYKKKNTLLLDA